MLDRVIAVLVAEVFKDALLVNQVQSSTANIKGFFWIREDSGGRVEKRKGKRKESRIEVEGKGKRRVSIPVDQDMGRPPKRCWKRRPRRSKKSKMGMKRVEAAGEQGRMGTVKDVSRVSGDSLVLVLRAG